ncbi:MAG: group 1 truncated hemoglobin [Pseudomonadales bacterium]|nr:group 1 truncated hemoglobin [Pseudomonadales bacterium]
MPAIEKITGNFIYEIGLNESISKHFEETDLDRFYNKMVEHLCEVSDGPCEYTGDSMIDVHTNMNINEAEFNLVVDLLINALNRSDIPHPTQNKLLARLAKLRGEMLYR